MKFAALVKSSKELTGKLDALEEKLHNPKAKVTYDIFAAKGGAMLYSQYAFLYASAMEGDGAPTQGMREVYSDLAAELGKLLEEFKGLLDGDLRRLNDEAKKLEVPTVFVPPVRSSKDKEKAKSGR